MDTRRDDTDAERYDRNWTGLVQELRVGASVLLPLSLLRRGTRAS